MSDLTNPSIGDSPDSPDACVEDVYIPEQEFEVFTYQFEVPSEISEIILSAEFYPSSLSEKASRKIVSDTLNRYLNTLPPSFREQARDYYSSDKHAVLNQFVPLHNAINFAVFDPHGNFRGRYESRFFGRFVKFGRRRSSPGFVNGQIPPGVWRVKVYTHALVTSSCKFRINIWFKRNVQAMEQNYATESGNINIQKVRHSSYSTFDRKERWYPVELHVHSKHSDGTFSVARLRELMLKHRGLSYFALTDHNTISGLDQIKGNFSSAIIPGMEITTFYGHATALGIYKYIEWKEVGINNTWKEVSQQVHQERGLLAIAHPFSMITPLCAGCFWEYDNADLSGFDMLEIWNGPWEEHFFQIKPAIRWWLELLNSGYEITAVSGTDFHNSNEIPKKNPVTYVRDEDGNATIKSILENLEKQKALISTGPEIRFVLIKDGKVRGRIGDRISLPEGEDFKFLIEVQNIDSSYQVKVYKNGDLWKQRKVVKDRETQINGSKDAEAFYHCEIYQSKSNELVALTNPIFLR